MIQPTRGVANFKRFWLSVEPGGRVERFSLGRVLYTRSASHLLRMRLATLAVVLALVAAMIGGWLYATRFPLPQGLWSPQSLTVESSVMLRQWFLASVLRGSCVEQQHTFAAPGGLLAVFSFGALAVALLMAPLGIIDFSCSRWRTGV